jgi:hypothetical protein
MTEDQIMQRVAESQKRVFSDIDRSKPSNKSSESFNLVGSNGITVQGSGKEAAISVDTTSIEGKNGQQGPQGIGGPQGDKGDTGEPGVGVVSATLNDDFSFTFTLSDGSQITTAPIQTIACN